ncbi:MAG: hypothetical protein SGJ02_14425 [bacterium]|nr:hypothetical protein [bacterium]
MKKTISLILIVALSSCITAAEHANQLPTAEERKMTVGTVQREIRNGMPASAVAESLGAPNIVTKDDLNQETWIYDKIATEVSYSNSSGGAGGVAGAIGSALLLGIGGGSYEKNAGASGSTQRVLTVVIKFDPEQRVKSATYHSSSF